MTNAWPASAGGTFRAGPADRALGLGQRGRVLVVIGAGCVILGGLVAAVTGPLRLAEGSWLAAYLVLVCGVSQYAMGRVPTLLAVAPTTARRGWALIVCWNLGNLAVIAGTVLATPALVDAGAIFLVVGLTIAWLGVRPTEVTTERTRLVRRLYRSVLLLLLVSLPIGTVLAHLRHG